MQRIRSVLLGGVMALALPGCATAFRHGNGLTVVEPEAGQNTRKIAMNLSHATAELQIFENGQPVPLRNVRDKIWSTAAGNAVRQRAAEASARPGGMYSWEVRSAYGPGLFLDPGRPHTLRLVRGTEEATVTVQASVRPKWIVRDMFLFALAPVGWIVDGVTGMWKEFPRLDVDRAFRDAARGRASGSE